MNVNVFGGPDLVIGFTKMAPAEQSTGSCRNRGFPALLGGFFSKRLRTRRWSSSRNRPNSDADQPATSTCLQDSREKA